MRPVRHMLVAPLLLAVALAPLVFPRPVGAEDVAIEAPAPATPSHELTYEEFRRDQLEYLAKRSRRWLIGSAAATAAGIALVTPAAVNECVRVASSASYDDLRCSTTGQALLGVGIPLLIAGATGVLVTAIMLGTRKGKIRHIDDRRAYEQSRAMRWDPVSSRFVF